MTDTAMPGLPTDLPLPPSLCETWGYRHDARYVGFCWWGGADTVAFDDGINSGTGNGWAFQEFRRHRAVAPLLKPFDLGSLRTEATHAILIDRTMNRASVCPIAEAEAFLRSQHSPETPLIPDDPEALRRELDAADTGWREVPVDMAAVMREMDEQRGRVGRMQAWLNMCPVPGKGEGRG